MLGEGESPEKIPKKIREYYVQDFYADFWSDLGFLHLGILRSGLLHLGKVFGAGDTSKKLYRFDKRALLPSVLNL
jgi:hypothetical protein